MKQVVQFTCLPVARPNLTWLKMKKAKVRAQDTQCVAWQVEIPGLPTPPLEIWSKWAMAQWGNFSSVSTSNKDTVHSSLVTLYNNPFLAVHQWVGVETDTKFPCPICFFLFIQNTNKEKQVEIPGLPKEMRKQWTGTRAIRRQIPPSKPKWEITKITNRQDTMKTNG